MSRAIQQALASLPLPDAWRWRVDVRPRRRTLGIDVEADGSVVFAVPDDADPQAVADAVRSRLPRLTAEVRRRRPEGAAAVKQLVSGTGLDYLGRRYRLRVAAGREGHGVRLRHGWFEMPRPGDPAEGGRWLTSWYVEHGDRWLAARLPPLAGRLGVTPKSIDARDLGDHWGTCDPHGAIVVHWAVMQLPPRLIDYVLVHELAHLRAPGHGAAFRRQVRLALPDADARAALFEAEERRLWRGAVHLKSDDTPVADAHAPPHQSRNRSVSSPWPNRPSLALARSLAWICRSISPSAPASSR